MITPEGVLFSREAILENLLAQKKANKRKLAAWEAQQQTLAREVGPKQPGAASQQWMAAAERVVLRAASASHALASIQCCRTNQASLHPLRLT